MILQVNWETLLSCSAKIICLQSFLLSSVHFPRIPDNLTWLGGAREKLPKPPQPRGPGDSFPTPTWAKRWQCCHFTANPEMPGWVTELPEVNTWFMGGEPISSLCSVIQLFLSCFFFSHSAKRFHPSQCFPRWMLTNPPECSLISLRPLWSWQGRAVSIYSDFSASA